MTADDMIPLATVVTSVGIGILAGGVAAYLGANLFIQMGLVMFMLGLCLAVAKADVDGEAEA